jgi:hypothetical protein
MTHTGTTKLQKSLPKENEHSLDELIAICATAGRFGMIFVIRFRQSIRYVFGKA